MNFLTNIFNTFMIFILPLTSLDPSQQFEITTMKFDFIIVGGGTAGCVLASRLTENPNVTVLLLEVGGYPTILNDIPGAASLLLFTDQGWKFKVAPQTNAFLAYPNNHPTYLQGKVLGGTNSIGGLLYIRGNPDDYDNWESMGNPGWGWTNCLPYFLKAEGNRIPSQENNTLYHNTSGPVIVSLAPYSTSSMQSFLQSCQVSGYGLTDVNGPNQTGVAQNPLTMDNGDRCSTYTAYIKPVSQRKNLVVVTNALVTKILVNSQKQATGVQYVINGTTDIKTVYASKEVIISAGTIGSPKLLMLSGIGPIGELQQHNIDVVAELPGVGSNLHDHVGCGALIWTVNCTGCTYTALNAISPNSFLDYLINRDGPLTVWDGNEGVAFLETKYANHSTNKPDIEIQFVSLNVGKYLWLTSLISGWPTAANEGIKYFEPFLFSEAFAIEVFNINPKSRGTLTLQSNQSSDPPIIDFKYLSNATDIEVLVAGVKQAVAIGKEPPFQSIGAQLYPAIYPGCENITQFSDEYYECMCRQYTLAAFHAVGTCKMGPSSDPMAVVNSNLEVYNVSQLRVVDASIIPQITSGNTCEPVTMIAEKIADVIKNKYNI